MLAAESPEEFGNQDAEDNHILANHPSHVLVNTQLFLQVRGSKLISARDLAFALIEAFQMAAEDDEDISVDHEAEAAGLEGASAMLWASENDLLKEIRLEEVTDSPMMNNFIKNVQGKVMGATAPTTVNAPPGEAVARGTVSMEMMAASSQSMVALVSRLQDGKESDRLRKELEYSILQTMGPSQRGRFTSLCTRRMTIIEPVMSDFMKNLTSIKKPQKARNLIQSETRNWEGMFSVGGFHRMLSNVFLSQEANRANPERFMIFMFHLKTVDLGAKRGKGDHELLPEYLGMEVDKATLEF